MFDFRAERKCYHERAAKGHQSLHSYFSMAIDGMDQNKTELPYSKFCYKGLDGVTKLRVHIIASMIHGRPPLLFLDWRQFRHDSNLTMNIILQVRLNLYVLWWLDGVLKMSCSLLIIIHFRFVKFK